MTWLRAARDNSKPVLPTLRVTPAVEARDHYELVFVDRIDHAVRKAPHHRPPRLAVYHRVEQRISSDRLDAGVQDAQELSSEPLPASFVPLRRLVDLDVRLRAEAEPARQPNRWCSRARTSSQEIADSGSRSCSARRRSISACCASVSGSASGSAAMLSQRSSANWIRSETLSLSNSLRGIFVIDQGYRPTTAASTADAAARGVIGWGGGSGHWGRARGAGADGVDAHRVRRHLHDRHARRGPAAQDLLMTRFSWALYCS